ncbi:oxidized low-density lipoprotein receptor 1-like [Mugil cephalus]|uniref:oxidized low-density lipoprotein receptor 1-like n=1 Tax=Mugil cephalus TaxID=48193 RepID=UPI001FB6CFFB|nr:oxidized low-density lipoprotein receptor 1-like [Mugil cephalus]
MEEEMNYSTVVFKISAPPSKEKEEEPVIYSEVKTKESVAAAPQEKEGPPIYSEVKTKESVAAAPQKKEEPPIYSEVKTKESVAAAPQKKEGPPIYSQAKPKASAPTAPTEGEASKHSHIRLLLLCLGILCILLVVTVIVVVVYLFLVTGEKDKQAANLTAENKQLIRDLVNMTEELIRNKNTTEELMRDLKNTTEELNRNKNTTEELIRDLVNTTEELNRNKNMTKELMRDRDDLNYTLRAILKYDSFPVSAFCSGLMVSGCNPCHSGWLLFQDKCYLFYNQSAPWKTWQESRDMCQNNSSDLVIIDSPGEQEFIRNHTEYYYDEYHGYWIGLKESNNTWFWVDGRNVTLE